MDTDAYFERRLVEQPELAKVAPRADVRSVHLMLATARLSV
ncbi:hypothetical protein [Novosphingobium sp. Gsoil 351]|nr:hypothetical protein [Novosphingobium sp. Gsoil 351]